MNNLNTMQKEIRETANKLFPTKKKKKLRPHQMASFVNDLMQRSDSHEIQNRN